MKWFSDRKGLLLLCAATLLNFSCGCGSEPVPSASEATLTVSPAAVNATFEAQTVTLTVNATGDWGVAAADKDWCTVSPSGGIKGTSEVKVNLATNRTGKERENTITRHQPDRQGAREHHHLPIRVQDAGSPCQAGIQRGRPPAGSG